MIFPGKLNLHLRLEETCSHTLEMVEVLTLPECTSTFTREAFPSGTPYINDGGHHMGIHVHVRFHRSLNAFPM